MLSKRFAFILMLTLVTACAAYSAVPPVISYQGKLMQPSGAAVPDGMYSIQFAIYDLPIGGIPLWSETNPSVQIKSGLFAILMGSANNLGPNILDSQERYLGIKVGNDSELTPRQRIASVACALRAGEADVAKTVLDGAITTDTIADGAITADKIAVEAIATTNIAPGAVTTTGIADGAITSQKLAADLTVSGSLSSESLSGAWDKSLSGYVRIGDMQIAWGLGGFDGFGSGWRYSTISYPASFSAIPSVQITPTWAECVERFGFAGGEVTKSGFKAKANIDRGDAGGLGYSWIAVGKWR